jgi:hypothetical protein
MPLRLPAGAQVAVRLAVTVLAAGLFCVACAAPASDAMARCTSFGVHAIRRHQVIRAVPKACAGLSREQVNAAVGSAVREAVGPRPKAAARRLAARDSRYLEDLVTAIPPGPPAALPVERSPSPGGKGVSLSAIVCWVLTASAGTYMVVRARSARRRRRWRDFLGRGLLARIIALHAGMAVACLGVLTAFIVTGARAVGWAAGGLVIITAGLGMATLVTALPEPASEPSSNSRGPAAAARRQPPPVPVIVLHGLLATATILLIWLAAIGGS